MSPNLAGRYFSWHEFTRSSKARDLGIPNEPSDADRQRIRLLCAHVLDPLRRHLGRPVRITSGYRSRDLNAAVGGSDSSQHTLGEAADIKVDGLSARSLAVALYRLGCEYDQIIWYAPERGGHVHVSYTDRRPCRRETLYAPREGGYVARSPLMDQRAGLE